MRPARLAIYRHGMQPTGIRARRRSVILLGAAGAAGVLTACADSPPTAPNAERLGQYPSLERGDAGGLAWSPKGDMLAATGKGRLALLPAGMATGGGGQPIVREAHGGKDVSSVAWSPDGARIVSLGWDETLQFWTAAGEPTHSVPTRYIFGRPRVRWSPAGNPVVLTNGKRLSTVDVSSAVPGPLVLGKAFARVADLTWAPDGRSFYALSTNVTVRMADAAGEPLATLRDTAKEITEFWRAAAVAPDGRVVVASRRDSKSNEIRVYAADLTTPGPEFKIPEACDDATAMQFSSDGRRVAVRFYDGPICVWEVTGTRSRLVGAYHGHSEGVEGLDGLAWQPGTDHVASLDHDGSIHLWRVPA
jgi:WD40 repeat protein